MPLVSRDRPPTTRSVETSPSPDLSEARRRFLLQCGKFAAATPPAVTLLLAASQSNYAAAQSSNHGSGGGSRTDYDNGSWIVRYPDGSYTFGRGSDGSAPPGIPPGHYSPTP